jgi:hypothetical protein
VAALINSKLGVEPELVEGGRGEFTVWVGQNRVAQKNAGAFPEDDEVLAAVQRAIA